LLRKEKSHKFVRTTFTILFFFRQRDLGVSGSAFVVPEKTSLFEGRDIRLPDIRLREEKSRAAILHHIRKRDMIFLRSKLMLSISHKLSIYKK